MALPNTGNLTANTPAAGVLIDGRFSGKSNLNPVLAASGAFGAGTLKLQAGFYRPDNVTIDWLDITGVSLTAAGYVAIPIRPPVMRLVLTGATGPNIFWYVG